MLKRQGNDPRTDLLIISLTWLKLRSISYWSLHFVVSWHHPIPQSLCPQATPSWLRYQIPTGLYVGDRWERWVSETSQPSLLVMQRVTLWFLYSFHLLHLRTLRETGNNSISRQKWSDQTHISLMNTNDVAGCLGTLILLIILWRISNYERVSSHRNGPWPAEHLMVYKLLPYTLGQSGSEPGFWTGMASDKVWNLSLSSSGKDCLQNCWDD